MRIKRLTINHVQRIESLTLDFPQAACGDGAHAERAPWTVITGENGTCKTTILQAVALTAAGSRLAPRLAGPTAAAPIGFSAMMVREGADTASASAVFTGISAPEGGKEIRSTVKFDATYGKVRCSLEELPPGKTRIPPAENPLGSALGRLEFGDVLVAAYGVNRGISRTGECPHLITPMDRLRPVFGFESKPVGPGLFTYFRDGREAVMLRMVNAVLSTGLLPDLQAVELLNGFIFAKQRVGGRTFPALLSSLPTGYQLVLSWVTDLIGHALDLSDGSLEDTREIVGLAMVDEVALCVHPNLQGGLVRGLMDVFPKVQFVVTSSSQTVLDALRPGEDSVVRLRIEGDSGLVVR